MANTVDRAHARPLLVQAEHDLQDAEILFSADRWVGVVRAAQAAVEKALKAVIYMRVGRTQAQVLIARHGHFVVRWIRTQATLARRLGVRILVGADELEQQVPRRASDNQNPEYPYAPPPGLAPPIAPCMMYRRRDAVRALKAARRTVRKVRRMYPSL